PGHAGGPQRIHRRRCRHLRRVPAAGALSRRRRAIALPRSRARPRGRPARGRRCRLRRGRAARRRHREHRRRDPRAAAGSAQTDHRQLHHRLRRIFPSRGHSAAARPRLQRRGLRHLAPSRDREPGARGQFLPRAVRCRPADPRAVDPAPRLIVGVVGNLKHNQISEAATPEMFSPSTQRPWPSMLAMQLLVRLRPAPSGALPQSYAQHIAAAVHAADPDVAVAPPQTLQRLVADSVAPARFALLLLAAFAGLALLLAAIGLYGVLALVAQQRRGEFSLRLALGASRASLFGLVLRQGARPATLGIGAGLLLAAAAGQFLRRYLFGVAALDPVAVSTAALVLAAVALAACLLPARRAARVDPIAALRED